MKKGLLITLVYCCFSFMHPFYLSVTDLKFNPKNRHIEGAVKVFVGDLEDALKALLKKQIDLIHPKDKQETKKILSDYLHKRLKITVNNKLLIYEVLGFEMEEESVWIYIESDACEQPKRIIVQNSILYDFLNQQMNIVNVSVNKMEKSLKVNYPETRLNFDF